MSRLFEAHRTDWELRITKDEVVRVGLMVRAMSRRASERSVVWVTKVSLTRRLWILRDGATLAWMTADASPNDPHFAIALPDHFVEEMMDLVADNDSVELFCDETENVIICRADGHYVAIDHPNNPEFTPFDVPYIPREDAEPGHHAVATVSGFDAHTFARSCINVPGKVDADFYPFVRVVLGDGLLRWTMDWRRYGLWRLTRAIPAFTHGDAQVTFYPWTAGRVITTQDPHDDVKVFVDGPDAEYVYFAGDDWGVRIINDAEHLGRWDHQVRVALDAAGCDVDEPTGGRLPDVIGFTTAGGHAAFASVHPVEERSSEIIRLTHVVATNVDSAEAVLREINAMNDSLVGARLVLREGEVRITVDMGTESLDKVRSRLADFTRAIDACTGLEVFLPLFGN